MSATTPSQPAGTSKTSAWRVIAALVLREMATTYGRSPGGYVWAILEPVAVIAVLSVGFSLLANTPPLGESFVLFYATGMLTLQFYATNGTKIGQAIDFNRALLKYPAVTWFDAVIARAALSTLTGVVVSSILLAGIMAWAGYHGIPDIPILAKAFAMCAVIGFGIGCLNAVLFSYFAIWRSVWSVLTRPLFIVSGVIFLYEDLPPEVQSIIWWNPIMHTVSLARQAFYPYYDASYVSEVYVWTVAGIACFLGLVFLRAHAVRVLDV